MTYRDRLLRFGQSFTMLLSISMLLICTSSGSMAADEVLQIGKLVLEPYNVGEPSGFLAPGKGHLLRIRAYNKEGKLLSDKMLQESVRRGKLIADVVNPVGKNVILHAADIIIPISWMPDGSLCVLVTAGADAGAAQVLITHKDFPEVVGRRLVSVGGTSGLSSFAAWTGNGFRSGAQWTARTASQAWNTHPYLTVGAGAIATVGVGAALSGGGGGGGGGGGADTSALVGTFSGTWWSDSIPGYDRASGTFTMTISDHGTVSGRYYGDDSGAINGSVSGSGTLSAGGSAGDGSWSGKITSSGGTVSGSGRWSGSGLSGGWSSN